MIYVISESYPHHFIPAVIIQTLRKSKNMKAILYFLSFLFFLSFSSCRKNLQEKEEIGSKEKSKSSDQIGWMRLNNEWIPVITGFDKLLYAARKAYSQKKYSESSEKIKAANEILLKKKEKDHSDKDELKKSSESLQKLSERIKDRSASQLDIDTVLYKVCDVSAKHCWIMQDREDDYWEPEEELNKHIDSAYLKTTKNDTSAITNLDKASALIKVKNYRMPHTNIKKYLKNAEGELNSIARTIGKEEKIIEGNLKKPIARSYFSLAITHYISASLTFVEAYDNKRLGNEIRSSSACLQKAFKYSGIDLKEEEAFTLEHAALLGIDLEKGFNHEAKDVQETLDLLGKLIKKTKMILYPEETEDDFMIS
jgi:hypothetical protein